MQHTIIMIERHQTFDMTKLSVLAYVNRLPSIASSGTAGVDHARVLLVDISHKPPLLLKPYIYRFQILP
jgi:competence transcription factor ComK